MGEQILLPRLSKDQSVDSQTRLQIRKSLLFAAERQHGNPTLDTGAAVDRVDPVRNQVANTGSALCCRRIEHYGPRLPDQ